MSRALTFRPGYALAAVALLLVEVAIALWVRDRWIRPVGGDVLAVLLVYCGLRAVTRLRVVPVAMTAVAVGFVVEAAQALDLADRLGLPAGGIARVVLGTSFAWEDLVAYAIGGALALLIERLRAPDRAVGSTRNGTNQHAVVRNRHGKSITIQR